MTKDLEPHPKAGPASGVDVGQNRYRLVHAEPEILDLVDRQAGVGAERRGDDADGGSVTMRERQVELDDLARFGVGGHASSDLTASGDGPLARTHCLGPSAVGYDRPMLWTILIILAIIALVLFILGRARRLTGAPLG